MLIATSVPCGCFAPLSAKPSRINSTRHVKFIRASKLRVFSQKNDAFRVATSIIKTGRDVLESGTKLVPESVPRPVARGIVAMVGVMGASFLLKSLLSIATFILGVGGLAYVAYVYFNRDDDPSGGISKSDDQSTDSTLEEARRIMDKYR